MLVKEVSQPAYSERDQIADPEYIIDDTYYWYFGLLCPFYK